MTIASIDRKEEAGIMDPEEAENTLRALREQAKPLLIHCNDLLAMLDQVDKMSAEYRRKVIALHDQLDEILDSEK